MVITMRSSVNLVRNVTAKGNHACINAIWEISTKCNYSCPYCINEVNKKNFGDCGFPEAKRWATAWNRIEEELIINITGGEPFLWEGLIDFIYLLEEDKRVRVKTNGSLDLLEFVQKVPPQKCIQITMCYHPSQQVSLQHFIGKVMLLKNRGFNVNVNYVAYPEQIWIIPELLRKFRDYDIVMNVDTYRPNGATPYYSFNEAELEFLKQNTTDHRKAILEREKTSSRCNAGSGYFVVLPDGNVYRCLTKVADEAPLGNLLDEEFKLLKSSAPCEKVCNFSCDRDYSCRKPLQGGIKMR